MLRQLFRFTLCCLFLTVASCQAPSSTIRIKTSNSKAYSVGVHQTPWGPREQYGRMKVMYAKIPHYPKSARISGASGTVKLLMLVGADGKTKDARILESAGDPVLDHAGLMSAKSFKFEPLKPAKEVVIVYPIRFTLAP